MLAATLAAKFISISKTLSVSSPFLVGPLAILHGREEATLPLTAPWQARLRHGAYSTREGRV